MLDQNLQMFKTLRKHKSTEVSFEHPHYRGLITLECAPRSSLGMSPYAYADRKKLAVYWNFFHFTIDLNMTMNDFIDYML